jgi:hypothetical protein
MLFLTRRLLIMYNVNTENYKSLVLKDMDNIVVSISTSCYKIKLNTQELLYRYQQMGILYVNFIVKCQFKHFLFYRWVNTLLVLTVRVLQT